jgi:hypothetical protein
LPSARAALSHYRDRKEGPLGTEFAPLLHQRVNGNPFPKRLRNIQLHPFLPVSYPFLGTTAGLGTAPFTGNLSGDQQRKASGYDEYHRPDQVQIHPSPS